MSDETLKPCPFCGGKGVLKDRAQGWIVQCENRFNTAGTDEYLCPVNARTRNGWNRERAVTAWNTRKEPTV